MQGLLKWLSGQSEFWLTIAGLLGGLLTKAGIIDEATYNTAVMPLIVYILGRITSKIAKKATNTEPALKEDVLTKKGHGYGG